MDYVITQKAQKDIEALQTADKKKIARVLESIENATDIIDIPKVQKIKGSKESLYRIKITPYRVFFIALVSNGVKILSVERRNERTYKKL